MDEESKREGAGMVAKVRSLREEIEPYLIMAFAAALFFLILFMGYNPEHCPIKPIDSARFVPNC